MILNKIYSRTSILLGEENIQKLNNSKILIIGLGGVGGICMEILARVGIQNFTLVDKDTFEETNLNRQILSNIKNLSKSKVVIAKKRLLNINPDINVKIHKKFANIDNIKTLTKNIDIVVDATDSAKAKLEMLVFMHNHKIKVFSSMGAGFTTDINSIKTDDISKTKNCKLAKYIRKNLKKYGIFSGIKVVYSDELRKFKKENFIGSIATITNAFGIFLADLVIKEIIKEK